MLKVRNSNPPVVAGIVISSPYPNSLHVRHSDASPLSKNHKKIIWSEKLKKRNWGRAPRRFFFPFWSSKVAFFRIWCPFYTYYIKMLLFF